MNIILAFCCGLLAATERTCPPQLREGLVIGLAAEPRRQPADLHRGVPAARPAAARAGKPATAPFADPLPGALILTAIVISFGVVAFTIVLIKRTYEEIGTDDLDQMTSTDRDLC